MNTEASLLDDFELTEHLSDLEAGGWDPAKTYRLIVTIVDHCAGPAAEAALFTALDHLDDTDKLNQLVASHVLPEELPPTPHYDFCGHAGTWLLAEVAKGPYSPVSSNGPNGVRIGVPGGPIIEEESEAHPGRARCRAMLKAVLLHTMRLPGEPEPPAY